VDGRASHLTIDAHRRPHGRHEYDIALQELRIVGRIAPDQQIIDVQLAHDGALALELDSPQRADSLDPARGKQRGGDRSQPADRVGAWPTRLAQDEDTDGT